MIRDWTGFTVLIPEQHSLIIIGLWKKDKPDMWWWKCGTCTESSGVMSTLELEKLDAKGWIVIPDPNVKIPTEYSKHPKEGDSWYNNYDGMYGYD